MKKNQKCIFIVFLFSFLLTGLGVSAQWGYTIGQHEIPKVVIQKDSSSFIVYPGHPKLFFRDTDLPTIRQRIKGDFKQEWQEMVTYLETTVLPLSAATFAEGSYLKNWTNGRNMTFVAVVTGEEKYINWAKQWAKTLVMAGTVGNDDQYRGRLMSMAVAYDWLYPWLLAAEKQDLEKSILEHIEKNWYFAASADFVGGHSRWGNFALATGLLVLSTEHPELLEKLRVVRHNWLKGYHPAQGWIAQNGGYHMGWSYSGAYLGYANHSVWSSSTNDCVYYPWQGMLPLFWLYGKQGDGMYANTGDAYVVKGGDLDGENDLITIATGIFKNPNAAWLQRKKTDHFADILYGDKSVKALAPDDHKHSLPLSLNFGNAGVVIARDRWDEKTTLLQFRSVPFYSANHHHRDENCFTLHYKGPLIIDSGLYDEGGPNGGYGSIHWRNYFTRTIAHNGIIIFDPKQKYEVYGQEVSNDGGQTYRNEPTKLEDILPGGHAHLDGITHYQNTDEYTYMAGDATKAYDTDRVKLAQREVVYLRSPTHSHPVVVIFDRVESTKPEFEKRFLLHTVNQPTISQNLMITQNNGGRLSCLTIYPKDAILQLVGGSGKEFWVNGKNYPLDADRWPKPNVQPGAWRLEVSPKVKQSQDYFLHILFVDDDDALQVKSNAAMLIEEQNNIGVRVAGWKIMFPKAAGGIAVLNHEQN